MVPVKYRKLTKTLLFTLKANNNFLFVIKKIQNTCSDMLENSFLKFLRYWSLYWSSMKIIYFYNWSLLTISYHFCIKLFRLDKAFIMPVDKELTGTNIYIKTKLHKWYDVYFLPVIVSLNLTINTFLLYWSVFDVQYVNTAR